MSSLRNSASRGIGKFILFGLLALAAGGLVFTDVGGFFRGGVSGSDVARVAGKTIPIQSFDRTVRRTISRLGIPLKQAYDMGYIREILNSEVRGYLMLEAARDYDIEISKEEIAKQIETLVKPMVQDGQSIESTLEQLLLSQSMSEQQLVVNMRKDLSLNLLQNALQSGFPSTSKSLLSDIGAYQNETRSIGYIAFPNQDFKGEKAPSQDDLSTLYTASKESYAIAETRQGQLIIIDTKSIEDKLDITQDMIRSAYDENIDAYEKAETRRVEQAILQTEENALKIIEEIKAGSKLKAALITIKGNATDYISLKPVTEANILEDLKESVFSAKAKEPLGPIKTPLGYHVLVLKEIIEPHTAPFNSVKAALKKELAAFHLAELKQDMADTLDDLLASGATPEDIQSELDIKITELPALSRYGKAPVENTELDKAQILERLFELEEGQSSAVFETNKDNMAAIFLKNITQKTYRPLETIKEPLEKRWIADQKRIENRKAVLALFASIQDTDIKLSALAAQEGKTLKMLKDIPRGGTNAGKPPAPLSSTAVNAVFETALHDVVILDLVDGIGIARVTSHKTPPLKREQSETLKQSLIKNTQNEGLSLFIDMQNKKYPAMLNDRLLEQAYGQAQ